MSENGFHAAKKPDNRFRQLSLSEPGVRRRFPMFLIMNGSALDRVRKLLSARCASQFVGNLFRNQEAYRDTLRLLQLCYRESRPAKHKVIYRGLY